MIVKQRKSVFLATLLAASISAAPALAEGDATAGKAVFKKNCRVCHQIEKERNGAGPHLIDIMGREAASLPKFKLYSKPMKASGIVWDDEQIAQFLKSPKKFMKGTRMGFRGLKDDGDIADIIAYLTDPSAAE